LETWAGRCSTWLATRVSEPLSPLASAISHQSEASPQAAAAIDRLPPGARPTAPALRAVKEKRPAACYAH